MKNSLINRFLNGNITQEELKMLHGEVNRNEESMLDAIEQDWINFAPKQKMVWPEEKWQEIESKISPKQIVEKPMGIFELNWPMKIAATLLIIASVWFAIRVPEQEAVVSDESPLMITEVNDSNQPSTVILKDGTKVTLTAHSTLSYYENYNSKYRVVHLEGEGYFETDQSNTRPFVVISDNITSICRGKEFSISAYKESDEINVTLASGRIEIAQNDRMNSENNKVSVESCQRYSFNKSNQQYLIGQISDCEYSDKVRSMKSGNPDRIVSL